LEALAEASPQGTSYDLVPYYSQAFPQTHPDRLYVIGRLLGLQPPTVESARILELGCASGGNILPMADQLPGARFLGIDMSRRQIEQANAVVEAGALGNIAFECADIATFDPAGRSFDYVIMHGVFSWIPDAIRRRSLELIRSVLSPHGIAFVSYNAYPGWHMRGAVRGIVAMHAARFSEPARKVAEARALIQFLQKAVDKESPYGRLLASEASSLQGRDDYVFHEHLEDHNQPFYVTEFLDLAAAADLQFLSEANFTSMTTFGLDKEVAETLRRVAGNDVRLMEQYLDLVRNTYFRQTLLIRSEAPRNRVVSLEALAGMHLATALKRDAAKDQGGQVAFSWQTTQTLPLTRATTAAGIEHAAAAWPRSVSLEEYLGVATRGVARQDLQAQRQQALKDALELFARGFVEFRPRGLGMAAVAPSRPVVGPATRAAALRGQAVANRRHEPIKLSDLARHAIVLCDGTRDAAQILDALVAQALSGALSVKRGETLLQDEESVRATLAPLTETLLRELSARGFLEAPPA